MVNLFLIVTHSYIVYGRTYDNLFLASNPILCRGSTDQWKYTLITSICLCHSRRATSNKSFLINSLSLPALLNEPGNGQYTTIQSSNYFQKYTLLKNPLTKPLPLKKSPGFFFVVQHIKRTSKHIFKREHMDKNIFARPMLMN